MTHTHAREASQSERGMALIMVILLLAVVSSLAAGLTMNGRVEVAMAYNEATYAGTRAAAEAGMNRALAAIVAPMNNERDLLAQPDIGDLLDGTSPYTIDVNNEYSYIIEIFDDDDPALYPGLTLDQVASIVDSIGEDGNPLNDLNERLILRVTGFGPNGTTVRLARILESFPSVNVPTTGTTTIINPALLVNGDLLVTGAISITGSMGNMHANGDLTMEGNSWTISGDATAAGTFTGFERAGGVQGGGWASIPVPDVDANSYSGLATHVMDSATGIVTPVDPVNGPGCALPNCGWTFSGSAWTLAGNSADTGTYLSTGPQTVVIAGNPHNGPSNNRQPVPLSIIAVGSIDIQGNPTLSPYREDIPLQFVTNGDLRIAGNVTADRTVVEGQSLVREQLHIPGNPDLRGQIIVQDVRDCDPCSSLVTANSINGSMSIVYDGSFGDIESEIPPGSGGATTYTYIAVGWMEGM